MIDIEKIVSFLLSTDSFLDIPSLTWMLFNLNLFEGGWYIQKMGLHMVAVASFHWQLARHGLNPAIVAGIVGPLTLKLLLCLRVFRDEAVHATRFFFFRLGHIVFNREIPFAHATRLERALRLILRTVTTTTPTPQDEELTQETFNVLSTFSL
ncbi:hypothetical protein RJT34_05479 [Clitoria ternatea]|uniref:Uncharacterized protein n=1 Tax=Clitoria ternatea TaxID=43366 RepID=A0AAN9K4I9_CLITE